MTEIINKVASSGLITIDLETLVDPGQIEIVDIANQLWQGLALREKDFREFVKNNDWAKYTGKHVGLFCSADAIVPTWAYMLLSLSLEPFAARIYFGDKKHVENSMLMEKIMSLDVKEYQNARVVVKGCSDKEIPVEAYVMLASRLRPVVKSLMYGEPCSTVPLFKSNKSA